MAYAAASSPAPPRNADGALAWYAGVFLGFVAYVPLLMLCADAVCEAAALAGYARPALGDASFLFSWTGAAAVVARGYALLRRRSLAFARGLATGAGVVAGALLVVSATVFLWGE